MYANAIYDFYTPLIHQIPEGLNFLMSERFDCTDRIFQELGLRYQDSFNFSHLRAWTIRTCPHNGVTTSPTVPKILSRGGSTMKQCEIDIGILSTSVDNNIIIMIQRIRSTIIQGYKIEFTLNHMWDLKPLGKQSIIPM